MSGPIPIRRAVRHSPQNHLPQRGTFSRNVSPDPGEGDASSGGRHLRGLCGDFRMPSVPGSRSFVAALCRGRGGQFPFLDQSKNHRAWRTDERSSARRGAVTVVPPASSGGCGRNLSSRHR